MPYAGIVRIGSVKGPYLVWHGGRSDLARDGALLKVTQADVGPHVSVKVQKDVVKTCHGVKQLRYVVVRLDLHDHTIRHGSPMPQDMKVYEAL